ncbi:protein PHLOEM PROTEIN 2-LIKE A1 [Manihot esculenta]|uniref:Uncharacterized protein n=1 Tax=Manihot esculenta TaxID=3983 RepID=A0ACB7HZ30_MANES|nr:protein PHLOEM PROTEIN 2-LIKE A1 [Manihot esculenta]KAG8657480.1 hypothetical protein MANES_03G070740v8 [Manihot esculenta]
MGASQSQASEEACHNQPQYTEEATEIKLSETKSKTEENAAEPQPQTKSEEKARNVMISDTNSKRVLEIKLPYNYESLLREVDSPVDRSSTEKLYHQLCTGVFLNQKKRKYWIERMSNSNCFFLFARDLSITWAEDSRFWHWPYIHETSDISIDVAELLNVCWLEVHGKFDTTELSPGVLYEVAFVIMLKDPAYGWEVPVYFRLTLPNGIKQERKEILMTKPRVQWIEIPVGEFIPSQENCGEMEISMFEYSGVKWKRGLVVKGVIIRPKHC